jgi:hypothetical protein
MKAAFQKSRFPVRERQPMRSGSILFLVFAATTSGGRDFDSYPCSFRELFHNDSMHETYFEPRKCAHIVILELPSRDPNIVKPTGKKFKSNMPILKVPPPCLQDSAHPGRR